ncbi:hypothetical protein ILUMI_10904 [Ignelater luminosus]|uniref:THAP-type domain-containing protein n=1 Tax=Ignelater luminosus TaxID=2038154 RepID=A0A8K0D183_IGNLU|nr:hypothetical protein ILUMI_10904 [Ignelater luminosus]
MVLCSAVGCSNRTDRNKSTKTDVVKITFHQFPKDIELRNKWIKAVRREDWFPSEMNVLCSTHFVEDCFNRTLSLTKLRSAAVPTIFPAFPSYLQQPAQKQRRQLKRKLFVTEELSQVVDSQPSTSSSVPHQ